MENNKCKCLKKCTCSQKWKQEYEDYLEIEKCKPEVIPEFNLCDYEPDAVYLIQYRPKAKRKQKCK